MIQPIAARLWGSNTGGKPRAHTERLRHEKFEYGLSLVLQACETAAEFDVPYLSPERIAKANAQIETATRNLAALKRRIAEVRA
mgnify:CR=1 FL=1